MLQIIYDTTNYKFKDIKEFITIVEEKMNLPKGLWSNQNFGNDVISSLTCYDFSIFASLYNNSVVFILSDTMTMKKIRDEAKNIFIEGEKLKQIENIEKKKNFKP